MIFSNLSSAPRLGRTDCLFRESACDNRSLFASSSSIDDLSKPRGIDGRFSLSLTITPGCVGVCTPDADPSPILASFNYYKVDHERSIVNMVNSRPTLTRRIPITRFR